MAGFPRIASIISSMFLFFPLGGTVAKGAVERIVALPFSYYTPDTRLAVGAGAVLYGDGDASVQASTILTQKGQFFVQAIPDLLFQNGQLSLKAEGGFYDFPREFFGLGNRSLIADKEIYTARALRAELWLARRWSRRSWLGLHTEIGRMQLAEHTPGGLVAAQVGAGGRTDRLLKLGPYFRLDRRDSPFLARSGDFLEASLLFHAAPTVGSRAYRSLQVDYRFFSRLGARHSLATQAVLQIGDSQAPFYRWPAAGGSRLLRGYPEGRYRGTWAFISQLEYRAQLDERWLWTAFGGGGVLQDRAAGESPAVIPTLGGGLRYLLDPAQSLSVRADLAWGKDSSGLYVVFGEAF